MRFLALLLGWWVYEPFSRLIRMILCARGVRVGKGFYIQETPYLKIRGRPENIIIGDNVKINGYVDLRNRENGRIVIEDNVRLDTGIRLVAANDAVLRICSGARIGSFCIFNCGTNVTVGRKALFASFCYVQSSNHGMRRGQFIQDQPHTYGEIQIGQDVWLGGHVSVLAGVRIGDGAVVGAKSVVTKDMPANCVCAGVPARVIGERRE